MEEYLQASEVINWQHPAIAELAQKMGSQHQNQEAIAKACFGWVREDIYHSTVLSVALTEIPLN